MARGAPGAGGGVDKGPTRLWSVQARGWPRAGRAEGGCGREGREGDFLGAGQSGPWGLWRDEAGCPGCPECVPGEGGGVGRETVVGKGASGEGARAGCWCRTASCLGSRECGMGQAGRPRVRQPGLAVAGGAGTLLWVCWFHSFLHRTDA